jgi:hypothetical protein
MARRLKKKMFKKSPKANHEKIIVGHYSLSTFHLLRFVIIFGLVGGIIIWKSLAAGTPTPIPAANVNGLTVGPGFVEATDREIVRTAANKVYVIVADDNPCQISSSTPGVIRTYKGSGAQAANANVPTAFSEVDTAHHPVSAGSGTCISGSPSSVLWGTDIRLDSSGIIHLAYIDLSGATLYYQTFSTLTDTWGSRTAITTGAQTNSGTGWPRAGHVALTLDASDVPHVVYPTSGASNSIKYTNKVSGSWSTPVTIFSGTNEMQPALATARDGTIHLAWIDNSLATHAVIKYAHYVSGSWSAVETVSAGDNNVLSNGDHDQMPAVATDLNNLPHVIYNDGTVNGSDNYIRLRYRTAGGVWTDNTPPGTAGGASSSSGTWYNHTSQNYISSTGDEFVFLGHDINVSPGVYSYQVGGPGNTWSPANQLDPRNKNNVTAGAPGLDGSASIRWDPLRDNNPGIIDVLYYDENDGTAGYDHHATVYYKAIVIGDTGTPTPQDTTPPTVFMSAPTDGSTVSGTTTVSATASDNVGVAGVQFKIDGVNLGSEVTTSPYSVSWNTAAASNGSHTLTAVARDAAGNTTTSTTLTVTVSNTVPSQLLVGTNTVNSSQDADTSGMAEAFSATASASGTLGKMSIYIDSGNAATTVVVGIYSDNAGHPGTLLTQSSISSPTVSAWNTVAVSNVPLTSGTKYWIALLGTGGTVRIRDQFSACSVTCSETSAQTNLTSLPATWTTGAGYRDGNISAYSSS